MSFDLTRAVWNKEVMPAGRKLVLLQFADADSGAGVFQSNALRAARSGMQPRAMQMHTKALLQDGLIRIVRHQSTRNGPIPVYEIVPEGVAALPNAPVNSDDLRKHNQRKKCAGAAHAPTQNARRTGAENALGPAHLMRPNQPYKPVKEPTRAGARREHSEFEDAWKQWPRPGSHKTRSREAWHKHPAEDDRKLAAVRAFLASKQAQSEDGRYVPYMQRFLTDSLTSFVEVAEKSEALRQRFSCEIPAPVQSTSQLGLCGECGRKDCLAKSRSECAKTTTARRFAIETPIAQSI